MNIYESILGVMQDCGAIGKDRRNQQQGFAYRGVEDVMNNLQPLFVKHGVFVVPEVLEQVREERTNAKGTTLLYSLLKVRFTFTASDGSSVAAVTIGEGMDSGDKASNKAMSVAFKYACFQVFCIPTEEMVDADAESHEVISREQEQVIDARARLRKEAEAKNVAIEAIEKRYGKVDTMDWLTVNKALKAVENTKAAEDGNTSEAK